MELVFKDEAVKRLKKLPPSEKKKARKKIQILSLKPYSGKPLKGKLSGLYSFRAWPLRIIYTLDTKKEVITIETVDFRGNVYKN